MYCKKHCINKGDLTNKKLCFEPRLRAVDPTTQLTKLNVLWNYGLREHIIAGLCWSLASIVGFWEMQHRLGKGISSFVREIHQMLSERTVGGLWACRLRLSWSRQAFLQQNCAFFHRGVFAYSA